MGKKLQTLAPQKLDVGHHVGGHHSAESAAAGAIMAIAVMVENDPEAIVELDVNPLMVLAKGLGVVAADALICLNQTGKD